MSSEKFMMDAPHPAASLLSYVRLWDFFEAPTEISGDRHMFSKSTSPLNRGVLWVDKQIKPCPTCGAQGDEMCVRGRRFGAVWQLRIPFPEGHDSRRTANR